MANFTTPVSQYMCTPVYTIRADESLQELDWQLQSLGISSLAVVDRDDRLVGVVSRSDVLALGRRMAAEFDEPSLLTVPDIPVGEAMTRNVVTVGPEDSVATACRAMVQGWFHRVIVVQDGAVVGVLATRDVMQIISEQRVDVAIGDYVTKPLFVIRVRETIASAVARLEKTRVSGLVVMEHGWPIGLFSQVEALGARDLPPTTPVENVMNPAVVCMGVQTRLHRAAEAAVAMNVRRVIACRDGEVEGILTGMDFARAAM